ncbi:Mu transposase C-terminal domain-containing protein [Nostoc sp. KVJ3]|uniref:Mu transposase C-terminal domain-containing protein n=1 Tax=Nostoc sp. KVJ3 TaxID=457945 RepID=UPI0022374C2B|nr:Mu transposase C-terminal domain-containing protein [Nostoc sp. KVJ3]
MNKTNNPKAQAVWTLPEIYEYFCEYIYVIYDQREHPALGQSPCVAFEKGLTQSGMHFGQRIVNDENFQIFTLPSTPKGSAKVVPKLGVKVNHIYYWSIDDSFLHPEVEGTQVPIRYDPWDVGTAYAYVKNAWVRCISQHYSSLQGHSQREIRLASIEIRQQKKQYNQKVTIKAKDLAQYLESAEAQETLQIQRLRDFAATGVRQIVSSKIVKQAQSVVKEDLADIKNNVTEELRLPNKLEPQEINPRRIQPYSQQELW